MDTTFKVPARFLAFSAREYTTKDGAAAIFRSAQVRVGSTILEFRVAADFVAPPNDTDGNAVCSLTAYRMEPRISLASFEPSKR